MTTKRRTPAQIEAALLRKAKVQGASPEELAILGVTILPWSREGETVAVEGRRAPTAGERHLGAGT